jgi:hypothetical protein
MLFEMIICDCYLVINLISIVKIDESYLYKTGISNRYEKSLGSKV